MSPELSAQMLRLYILNANAFRNGNRIIAVAPNLSSDNINQGDPNDLNPKKNKNCLYSWTFYR